MGLLDDLAAAAAREEARLKALYPLDEPYPSGTGGGLVGLVASKTMTTAQKAAYQSMFRTLKDSNSPNNYSYTMLPNQAKNYRDAIIPLTSGANQALIDYDKVIAAQKIYSEYGYPKTAYDKAQLDIITGPVPI